MGLNVSEGAKSLCVNKRKQEKKGKTEHVDDQKCQINAVINENQIEIISTAEKLRHYTYFRKALLYISRSERTTRLSEF